MMLRVRDRYAAHITHAALHVLVFVSVSVAVAASAQPNPTRARQPTPGTGWDSWQFGANAQHTGRVPVRGPHAAPTLRWRVRAARRIASSPAIASGAYMVFAGVDGVFHAVDRLGIERWAASVGGSVFASPAFSTDLVLGAHERGLVALDTRGDVRWRYTSRVAVDASPTVGPDGTVYVAADEIAALDGAGRPRWSQPVGARVRAPVTVSRDGTRLFAGTVHGELLELRASDGVVTRRTRVGAAITAGALAIDDHTVVVGAADGHVRAYDSTGALRWDAATRDDVRSTPALGTNGVVIVGSDDGGVYGFRVADGAQAFRHETHGRVRASPRVDADGYIYIGSEDDVLYALEPNGALAWSFTLGSDIDSSVLLTPWGGLAVACDDGGLYYFE